MSLATRDHTLIIKACPHLFSKEDTLYPETGDFVSGNGNFVSGNRQFCCQKQQQNIMFPDANLLFLTMKSPETATKYPVSGYKVTRFQIQNILFGKQVWTGLKGTHPTLTSAIQASTRFT